MRNSPSSSDQEASSTFTLGSLGLACSHSADTTGSVRGIAWTMPDAALAAAASETADDVALKSVAIPNRVIDGDSDAPHPISAARAHSTLPFQMDQSLC